MIGLTLRATAGPVIGAPRGKGFGSSLVESTIAGHGRTISYDWLSSGLVARIRLPLEAISG